MRLVVPADVRTHRLTREDNPTMAKLIEDAADHYPDCPAVQKRPVDRGPCRCATLARLDEDADWEPPDMADRENGFI
jgi:hypothetical protein